MNDPIKVLITLPFPEEIVSPLKEVSPRLEINIRKAKQPDDIPDRMWEKTDILYTNYVLPSPDQAPNLRWIQFHWAGVDHILDNPLLTQRNLVATTLSGAAASQMAEYIVRMLLALGGKLPDLFAHQARSKWPEDRWQRFLPRELRTSTVGIVGYGSIGRQVARLLAPFGAFVVATKRDAMHPEDHGYIPEGMGDTEGDFVHRLYPSAALGSMLKECDFVVVTVPKTPETENLISDNELEALKPTCYLIDVSRGGIVDHTALINALEQKKIAGAALDVFPEEPLAEDSPLWKLPNVIITPHISGATQFYDERAMTLFATNLGRYLAGQQLYNRIDLNRGY